MKQKTVSIVIFGGDPAKRLQVPVEATVQEIVDFLKLTLVNEGFQAHLPFINGIEASFNSVPKHNNLITLMMSISGGFGAHGPVDSNGLTMKERHEIEYKEKLLQKSRDKKRKAAVQKCIRVRCRSERLAFLNGKTSQLIEFSFARKKARNIYVPQKIGISNHGHEKYITFSYCLECGQIQNKFPVSDPTFEEDEEPELYDQSEPAETRKR